MQETRHKRTSDDKSSVRRDHAISQDVLALRKFAIAVDTLVHALGITTVTSMASSLSVCAQWDRAEAAKRRPRTRKKILTNLSRLPVRTSGALGPVLARRALASCVRYVG